MLTPDTQAGVNFNQLKDLKEPGSCKQCPELGSPLAPGPTLFYEMVPVVLAGRRRDDGMVSKDGCCDLVSTERCVMRWWVSGHVRMMRLMSIRRRGPSRCEAGNFPADRCGQLDTLFTNTACNLRVRHRSLREVSL